MSSILTEKVTGEWAVPPYMITDPRLWETIPKRDGVSMVTLIEAGVRNVTPGQAKKWGMGRKGGGAIIPYRRFDNRKPLVVPQILPWETTSSRKLEIARLRRSKDVENDGKGKYDQARGTGTQIYVPPQFPAGHVEVLVLVEGEFKALSLMENGIPAIGLIENSERRWALVRDSTRAEWKHARRRERVVAEPEFPLCLRSVQA